MNALYVRRQSRFNSLAAIETERKNRAKTMGDTISGGNKTAKPTPLPPMVSGHSHSILPGGFDVTWQTIRLIPRTSLMMHVEV